MIISIILFIIGCFILVKSTAWLVRSLNNIAIYLHWSEFVVSFVLIAFGTSLPELFVGINAAFHETPTISLGNVIGSNIVNLTLIAGLAAVINLGLRIRKETVSKESWYVLFISALPVIFLLNGRLSQWEGMVLLFVFVWYLRKLFKQKRPQKRIKDHQDISSFFKSIFLFLISLVLLLASAELVVRTVLEISQGLNLNVFLISLFAIALGTSLPELAFGLRAMKGHRQMVWGNLLGSTVFNSVFILGLTSLIRPIEITNFSAFLTAAIFMLLVIFAFNLFIRSKEKLSFKEGWILILFYVIFVVIEFVV